SEGTHHGCGHYIITRKVAREDCRTKYCMNSDLHMQNCPHCPNCKRYFDPDASETVTLKTPEWCPECTYWYLGPGARHKK
ncbi:hypothetical protein M413DRAFT_73871, partial [Hebeloma cylindrosporum]